MKYWEIIADNLKKADWSLGCGKACPPMTKLTAFLKLEAAPEAVATCLA